MVSPKKTCTTSENGARPRLSNRTTSLTLGSLKPNEEKDESLPKWRDFLLKYATGTFSPSEEPPIPPLSSQSHVTDPVSGKGTQPGGLPAQSHASVDDLTASEVFSSTEPGLRRSICDEVSGDDLPIDMGSDFHLPVYDSVEISTQTALRVREFYKRHAYLPPPRAPLEVLRDQIIKEYDLYSQKQVENIQSAIDLVQAYFGGLCTFSLFQNNVQVLMACSGPPEVLEAVGLYPGKQLLPETSLCGHAVLFAEDSGHMYIPDLAQDWRYKGNPYADEMQGVRTYIGATVSLAIDPASGSDQAVAVGVINSMHLDGILPPLTAEQSKVMNCVARFLTEILRATWEGLHRTREARSRRVVSDFLDHIMIPRSAKSASTSDTQRLRWHLGKSEQGSLSERRTSHESVGTVPETPYSTTRSNVGTPADVSSAGNMAADSPAGSALSETHPNDQEEGPKADPLARDAAIMVTEVRKVLAEADGAAVVDLRSLHAIKDTKGAIKYVMDPESPHSLNTIAWNASPSTTERPDFLSSGARMALMKSLYMQQYDSEVAFEPQNNKTSGLESYLPKSTHSHLVIPFMAGIQPLFSIIITSSTNFWTFRTPDINFVRSMGVILRAQVLQSRVIESDMAKTTFLSSISHELRTPLHGLMSGLQLFEEAIDSEDLSQAAELLPIIKNSGYALQNILNDMLQFGQLAHGETGTKTNEVNLGQMVVAAVKTCIPRYFSWHQGNASNVSITVEYEDRDWTAKVDESGFQRILFNGITNAMKVTQAGNINVSLRSSGATNGVVLRIKDTGPGIDPKFASKLFQPFSKANSFKPGAGLGLYITKALVERMSGSVSLQSTPNQPGATFEVNLPVTLGTSIAGESDEINMIRESIDMVEAERNHGRTQLPKLAVATAKPNASSLPAVAKSSPLLDSVPTSKAQDPTAPLSDGGSEPLRVLVVDDNEISRKILMALLRKMSKLIIIETAQADDGMAAVETFKPFHPHLVLTDVSMPKVDGITASTEMRQIEREERRPRCQIFAITGLGSSDPRLKAAALRDDILDGWIVKGKDGLAGIRQIVLEASSARSTATSIFQPEHATCDSAESTSMNNENMWAPGDPPVTNAELGQGANTASAMETSSGDLDASIPDQSSNRGLSDLPDMNKGRTSAHKRRLSSTDSR